jgi:hypothetical protein
MASFVVSWVGSVVAILEGFFLSFFVMGSCVGGLVSWWVGDGWAGVVGCRSMVSGEFGDEEWWEGVVICAGKRWILSGKLLTHLQLEDCASFDLCFRCWR